MKTLGKVILGMFIGIILLFIIMIGVGVLIDPGILKSSSDEPEIRIEYKPQNIGEPIDEESIPDSEYYPSPEQAMKNSSLQMDPEEVYQKNMDEVIAKFENDNYASVYFKSIKDENTEYLTFAKFKKKVIEGQLSLSDFGQSINIDPENTRFVWGGL